MNRYPRAKTLLSTRRIRRSARYSGLNVAKRRSVSPRIVVSVYTVTVKITLLLANNFAVSGSRLGGGNPEVEFMSESIQCFQRSRSHIFSGFLSDATRQREKKSRPRSLRDALMKWRIPCSRLKLWRSSRLFRSRVSLANTIASATFNNGVRGTGSALLPFPVL